MSQHVLCFDYNVIIFIVMRISNATNEIAVRSARQVIICQFSDCLLHERKGRVFIQVTMLVSGIGLYLYVY